MTTRVALIGNSHASALGAAAARLDAAYPDLDFSHFALPRHGFQRAHMDDYGVLHADTDNRRDEAFIIKLNGSASIDLTPFDHIVVAGIGFNRRTLFAATEAYDILDLTLTGKEHTISLAHLQTLIDSRVRGNLLRTLEILGEDARITLLQAPYETEQILTVPDQLLEAARHPDAQYLMDMFETLIKGAIADSPYQVVTPPHALLAAPFLTKAQYNRAADIDAAQGRGKADFTHMNSDYGFEIFKAFAHQQLNLAPQVSCDKREV